MILIIFGRGIQFLLALAMMRVATTLLAPEEMGKVALVLTTVAFFALLLVNPVGMFINRRLHAWQASGVARFYLLYYLRYLALVALAAAVTLPLLHLAGLVDFGVPLLWLLVLACGSLIFNTINTTAIPSLNLLGDSRRFLVLSLATLAAGFVLALALVHLFGARAQYWLGGLLLGQALLGALGGKALLALLGRSGAGKAPVTVGRAHHRTLFHFAWPVAIAAGLGWVQGQGYRYLLSDQLGLAQLGLFVAGYGIAAGMIGAFESVLTTYFQPRLYRDANTGERTEQAQSWRRYAAAVLPSLALTMALIAALAPELTQIFLGDSFQAAAPYVVWGAFAEALRVLVGTYALLAHAYMRTRWLMLPSLLGAGAAVLLCVLLMPRFGAHGVGMALVASGLVAVSALHLALLPALAAPRQFASAASAALALAALALALRSQLGGKEWGTLLAVLAPVGLLFLALQYLFLKKHLGEPPAPAALP